MAHGRRPGGLTALAVLNFVVAGINLISLLAAIAVVALADTLKAAARTPQDRAVFDALGDMNVGLWVLIIASGALALVLLIVAGVGYLKMRKWGRNMGNIYALTAIASSVAGAILTPTELGGGLSIGTIIGLVYPTLTLYFINVTFKEELA